MKNMKIIPIKFFIILSIICILIFPILLYAISFIIFYTITFGNSIVSPYVLFVGLFFGIIIEILFIISPNYCKLIIRDGIIINNIFDGTNNDGWIESIYKIKEVRLVDKAEVQKYYKQFKRDKAILIDFGSYRIKYISAELFSKRQLKFIISLLKNDYVKK